MMLGVFALLGNQCYFNETLQKTNFQPCEFPLENWMAKKGFFIPLAAHSVAVLDMFAHKENKTFADIDVPPLCGILVDEHMKVYEVGVTDGQLRARYVPTGKGVMYVRAQHRDIEESFYAALRITKDLRKATELASHATLSLPGKPVYTSTAILAWAAFKQDPELIRTLDEVKLKKIVQAEVRKQEKAKMEERKN